MTEPGGIHGADALRALLGLQGQLEAVSDKDWAAAAGMIVKKLLLSAGQTPESLAVIKAAVGEDIFLPQLKSLTHHQARQLARRLDKRVPDFEVSTASAAVAHVRDLIAAVALPEAEPEPEAVETLEVETAEPAETAAETPAEQPAEPKKDAWGAGSLSLTDDTPAAEPATTEEKPASSDSETTPPAASPYFGRRSFRT
ncbi:hypothetical protein K1X12_10225 [Hyphomonas sp. WL0036]|uniref:hypothetical protein n=1 Tax=Hyphomonas sediminis TaxID=2866160 RepID=UPI001C8171CD|nr:hypothetical protein [Hyphomonas sediminis]MBY9067277.1 hypothetical protein [Hyphomonas sediminis]